MYIVRQLHYSSSIQITISWYLIHVERRVRNGNSISADVTEDTIENYWIDAHFCSFKKNVTAHNAVSSAPRLSRVRTHSVSGDNKYFILQRFSHARRFSSPHV
jgi:hypothetical protein